MTYALGFRVKSGHAVAVALAGPSASPVLLARIDVALSDAAVPETKQPYHAELGTARENPEAIPRLVAIVRQCARASIEELFADTRLAATSCRGAALVVGSLIDPEKVGNPHIRAHAREGRLFRESVEEALRAKHVEVAVILEKALASEAARELARSENEIRRMVAAIGRGRDGPWRSDEKAAATAAWVILRSEK
jgi:hypothetical protein